MNFFATRVQTLHEQELITKDQKAKEYREDPDVCKFQYIMFLYGFFHCQM